LSFMVPVADGISQFSMLVEPSLLIRWLPGVILGFLMLFLTHRSDNYLILPGLLIGSLFLFYIVAWADGTTVFQLQQDGWLIGPFSAGGLWQPFPTSELINVHWELIAGESTQMLVVVLVSTVGLLLNSGGLELATKRDMDLGRELRVAGIGNLFSGLVPGLIGYQQLSLSAMNFKLKANNRLTGLISVLVCVFALIFGAALLSLVPQVVIGGLLFFLGISFLSEWVVESWTKLPRIDYLIILSILIVTITIGFLEAVILGVMLAMILFVVGYSRIEIVRHEFSGLTFKSRIIRPRWQEQILKEKAGSLYILQLQGFIFFGTADQLLNRVRQRLNASDQPVPTAVYLDFRRITGLDSTGTLSFSRMKQIIEELGAALVFIGPTAKVRKQLEIGGLIEDMECICFFPDLDRAVQWGEDRLLEQEKEVQAEEIISLTNQLQKMVPGDMDFSPLLAYFERMDVKAGQLLISQGDLAQDLYVVCSGQVTAQLPRPNEAPIRLETMGSGHIIGEIGFYLNKKRTADVVVEESGIVYRLSLENMQVMEASDPEAAAILHKLMVHLLAERLIHLTESFNALEQE